MRRQAGPSILCNQPAIRQDLTGVALLFSWQRITAGHGSRGIIVEELSNASRFAPTYRPLPSQRPILGGCPPPPPLGSVYRGPIHPLGTGAVPGGAGAAVLVW